MKENKYLILCPKKKLIYFADDEGVHTTKRASRKQWKVIKEKFGLKK